jgi:hypothetical protein
MRPRLTGGESTGTLDHSFGTDEVLPPTSFDRLTHVVQRMISQQLQNPDKPPRAGYGTVVFFQFDTELGEAGRELPVPVHRSMVKRAWPAA